MQAKRTIHVLTDKKGSIVGGGILASGKDRKGKAVHVRITPLKGQSLTEVAMPADIARLKGLDLFQRLQRDFHLPRGKKELVRKASTRR
ncbi:MAG TPA: hypothetical protein VFQ34_14320 [Nitrospiraceae bacterium]|nr:hypothetical protein [Nitrospiraceae bacterium]